MTGGDRRDQDVTTSLNTYQMLVVNISPPPFASVTRWFSLVLTASLSSNLWLVALASSLGPSYVDGSSGEFLCAATNN